MRGSDFWRRTAAAIFGIVFLFGGVLKLMDPVGATLVMRSYLNFLHLGFLSFAAAFLSIFFALLECAVGIVMISGVWMREAKWPAFIVMGLFTLLTLLLLIFNPSMDCGCFGELIHLTHLQSFLKNIVLLLLLFVIYLPGKPCLIAPRRRKVFAIVAFAGVCVFLLHSMTNLPLLDLTDLRSGAELSEGSIPILGDDGEYYDDVLLDSNVLVISAYAPDRLSNRDKEKILQSASVASSLGLSVRVVSAGALKLADGVQSLEDVDLSAGSPSHSAEALSSRSVNLPVYQGDRKTLLSLNRANGGVTYISEGLVVKKWNNNGPTFSELSQVVSSDSIETVAVDEMHSRLWIGSFSLIIVTLLLI